MSVKFAPVCPINIYEDLAAHGKETIGDYFLLLAHDVLANKERYEKFFVTDAETNFANPPFIIMDNSVIELGSSVSVVNLLHAAQIVNANVLAIPDVLQDGALTILAAEQFLKDWQELTKGESEIDLMFIPQGNHATQYEWCAKHAKENFGEHIKWIGIARNLTGRIYNSRTQAFAALHDIFGNDVGYHMLGFSEDVNDDLGTCIVNRDIIVGIDSAVPLRALEPIEAVPDSPLKIPVGPRGDWWGTVEPSDLIRDNVVKVRKFLGEIA